MREDRLIKEGGAALPDRAVVGRACAQYTLQIGWGTRLALPTVAPIRVVAGAAAAALGVRPCAAGAVPYAAPSLPRLPSPARRLGRGGVLDDQRPERNHYDRRRQPSPHRHLRHHVDLLARTRIAASVCRPPLLIVTRRMPRLFPVERDDLLRAGRAVGGFADAAIALCGASYLRSPASITDARERHQWSKVRPGLQPDARARPGDVRFRRTCARHTSPDPAPRGPDRVTGLGR